MSHPHVQHEPEEPQRQGTWFDRLPAITSGLFGTGFSAGFVAAYWGKHPDLKPVAALLFFLCGSMIGSHAWHWLFYLRPRELSRRMQEETRRQHAPKEEPEPHGQPLHPR